jgi:uncharacterized protein
LSTSPTAGRTNSTWRPLSLEFLFATFCAAMAGAAFVIEGIVPSESERYPQVAEAPITWNYTTWANIAFLLLAAALVWRFLTTDGPAMLRMMNVPAHRAPHNNTP